MATRGNSSKYLKMRLKRDYPSYYAKLLRGRYPSPHAAAVAARIIKKRTPLRRLHAVWQQAPQSEKQAFLRWLRDRGEYQILSDPPSPDRLRLLSEKTLASLAEEQVRRVREAEERIRAQEKSKKPRPRRR